MYKYFGCIFFSSQSINWYCSTLHKMTKKSRERDGRKSQVKYQRDQQNIYRLFGSCRVSVVATIRWPTEEVEWFLYIIYLSRVARVEEECGAFKTDPVAFPAAFPRQLDLMFLPQQPFLDTQEASLPHRPRAVEGGSGTTLFGLNINIIIIMHF